MREGRSQGERGDHRAERRAPTPLEPGRDELEGGRVDARQRHSRHHSRDEQDSHRGSHEQGEVGGGRHEGAAAHHEPQRHEVGEAEEARGQRPHDEPDLNAVGEPGSGRRRQPEDADQLGRDGRGGEPGRHGKDDPGADQRQHAPSGALSLCFGYRRDGDHALSPSREPGRSWRCRREGRRLDRGAAGGAP